MACVGFERGGECLCGHSFIPAAMRDQLHTINDFLLHHGTGQK